MNQIYLFCLGNWAWGWISHIFFGKVPQFCRRLKIQDQSQLWPLNMRWLKTLWPFWLLLSTANCQANNFGSTCPNFMFGLWKCTKTRLPNPMAWQCLFHSLDMTVSKKASSGPQFWYRGYLTKVTYGKRAQIISVRYESILKKVAESNGNIPFTL